MADRNVIQIVIDTAQTGAEQVNLVHNSLAALRDVAGELAGMLSSPGGVAAGIVALGLAAVAGAAKFSDYVEELDNLEERTQVSGNRLRELQQVMIEAGQSPEALTQSMTLLRKALEDNDPHLKQMGVTSQNVFGALIEISHGLADGTVKVSDAQAVMGRQVGELLPVLSTLDDRLKDLRTRFSELAPEQEAAARAFDRMADVSKTTVKSWFDQALGNLTIGTVTFTRLLQDLIGTMSGGDTDHTARFFDDMQDAMNKDKDKKEKTVTHGAPTTSKAAMDLFAQMTSGSPSSSFNKIPETFGAGKDAEFLAKLMAESPLNPDLAQKSEEILGQMVLDMAMMVDHGKSASTTYGVWLNALQSIGDEAATDFADVIVSFEQAVLAGENAAQALHDAWHSALRSIADEAAKLAIGMGLGAIGTAIGGPIGGFVGKVGGKLIGLSDAAPVARGASRTTIVNNNIYTLDTKTLRTSVARGGGLEAAYAQNAIGARF